MCTTSADTMVDVVMDHGAFCFGYGPFDGMQLCCEVEARASLLDHRDDAPEVPFGTFQPGGDCGVACVGMRF
jgi:hypothetical protein